MAGSGLVVPGSLLDFTFDRLDIVKPGDLQESYLLKLYLDARNRIYLTELWCFFILFVGSFFFPAFEGDAHYYLLFFSRAHPI
jgi:hypothetical protein